MLIADRKPLYDLATYKLTAYAIHISIICSCKHKRGPIADAEAVRLGVIHQKNIHPDGRAKGHGQDAGPHCPDAVR